MSLIWKHPVVAGASVIISGAVILGVLLPTLFERFRNAKVSQVVTSVQSTNSVKSGVAIADSQVLVGTSTGLRVIEPRENANVEGEAASGLVAPLSIELPTASRSPLPTRATSHPHGNQLCASGCEVSHHPTPRLAKSRFVELVDRYRNSPPKESTPCLDELIYFGSQTALMLKSTEHGLGEEHRGFLQAELSKQDLVIELRIVDEAGKLRVYLPPTSVPQHVRQEFAMDVHDFQHAITSGTVKRVGLNHVWQRL